MMKLGRGRIFIGLGIFLVAIGGSFVYQYMNRTPTLRIAINEWAGYAPAVYAQALGLYDKYNLKVELIYSSGPTQSNEYLKANKVDGVSAVLADLILLRSNGIGVKAIFFTDYSKEGDSIVALPEIKNISQLKGKTIGIDGLNTFSHVFVLKTLEKNGLREKDVFFKIVNFDKVVDALKRNEIQAGHTWDPGLREALMQGYHRIATAAEIPGVILDTFAFRDEIINQYPEAIAAFTKIYFKAQEKMLENPFQASQDMKYFFKNDPDVFAKSFKEIHFISLEENRKRIKSNARDAFSKEALDIYSFYVKRGQTNERDLHHHVMQEKFPF